MKRFTILALLFAYAVLVGCANAPMRTAGAFASELPWNDSRGCERGRAPRVTGHYDPAVVAQAMAWVYRDHPTEPWCGCAFDAAQHISGDDCGYVNANDVAPTVTWAHVVPPSRFGVYRECWERVRTGDVSDDTYARRYCADVDPEFRAMEADLYNFMPAIAAMAELRADHPFGVVHGEPRDFGTCDVESQNVMGKSRIIEPPPALRGDIARTYLYMAARYGRGKDWKIKLAREQRVQFERWAQEDPVDDWERIRACRIHAIQGWNNPFVQ